LSTLYVVLWMSRSLDLQSNARRITIVKDMYKCPNHHATQPILYKCTRGLAKTNYGYT